jgi:hypothetical protein
VGEEEAWPNGDTRSTAAPLGAGTSEGVRSVVVEDLLPFASTWSFEEGSR